MFRSSSVSVRVIRRNPRRLGLRVVSVRCCARVVRLERWRGRGRVQGSVTVLSRARHPFGIRAVVIQARIWIRRVDRREVVVLVLIRLRRHAVVLGRREQLARMVVTSSSRAGSIRGVHGRWLCERIVSSIVRRRRRRWLVRATIRRVVAVTRRRWRDEVVHALRRMGRHHGRVRERLHLGRSRHERGIVAGPEPRRLVRVRRRVVREMARCRRVRDVRRLHEVR